MLLSKAAVFSLALVGSFLCSTTSANDVKKRNRALKGRKCGKDEEYVELEISFKGDQQAVNGVDGNLSALFKTRDIRVEGILNLDNVGSQKRKGKVVIGSCYEKNSCYQGLIGDSTAAGVESFEFKVDGKTVFSDKNFGIYTT